MNYVFFVERWGPFNWDVRAEWRYGNFWVGSFWRRSSAEAVAKRLNEIAITFDWPMREFLSGDSAILGAR